MSNQKNQINAINEKIDSLNYNIKILQSVLEKSIEENEKIRFRMSELEYSIDSFEISS